MSTQIRRPVPTVRQLADERFGRDIARGRETLRILDALLDGDLDMAERYDDERRLEYRQAFAAYEQFTYDGF